MEFFKLNWWKAIMVVVWEIVLMYLVSQSMIVCEPCAQGIECSCPKPYAQFVFLGLAALVGLYLIISIIYTLYCKFKK